MATHLLKLDGIKFLLADAHEGSQKLVSGILRSFGATAIHIATSIAEADALARRARVDMMIVDQMLDDAANFVQRIRRSEDHPCRHVPIIITCGHSRFRDIVAARDSGANMVLAKPVSPRALFDRLWWLANKPKPFVTSDGYCGPCRRFKVDDVPEGIDRRGAEDAMAAPRATAAT